MKDYMLLINTEILRKRLEKPLPGLKSHLRMAPEHRAKELTESEVYKITPKKSAVMILFYHTEDNQTRLVFIRRSDYVGIHAGQMGLPGGRFEEEDSNTLQTALRETYEEIGIKQNQIEIVGKLSGIYIPPSNFYVDPFVGFLSQKPEYKIDYREVKEIVEINIAEFFNKDLIKHKYFSTYGKNEQTYAPYYNLENVEIWGATAMILSEFVDVVRSCR